MNCSLLDDEDYEEDITMMIPLWIAEGQKEFTDNRMIWDWIKCNIRAHAIQYSKRKAKERGEKEFDLQEELPPFSLIRDFRKQNTRGNVFKISVSRACYRQIGSKSTNHSH